MGKTHRVERAMAGNRRKAGRQPHGGSLDDLQGFLESNSFVLPPISTLENQGKEAGDTKESTENNNGNNMTNLEARSDDQTDPEPITPVPPSNVVPISDTPRLATGNEPGWVGEDGRKRVDRRRKPRGYFASMEDGDGNTQVSTKLEIPLHKLDEAIECHMAMMQAKRKAAELDIRQQKAVYFKNVCLGVSAILASIASVAAIAGGVSSAKEDTKKI